MKATIGIIGGGQLGKMMAQEAKRLSLDIVVLDPTPDCPAALVCSKQIIADFKDAQAIRKLAQASDVVTYEIELGNPQVLKDLENEGHRIYPAAETLRVVQDKLLQKEFLKSRGLPVPEFEAVEDLHGLPAQTARFGYPCLLKCRTDSYDGRGNFTLKSPLDLEGLFESHALNGSQAGKRFMLERFVPFVKEVSVMAARNRAGQVAAFPVAENIHREHILHMTIAPARVSDAVAAEARKIAAAAVEALDGVGIFGVEMFVGRAGEVLINEIAPRPHNSGHYTIEACAHSQFELHLRAILNLPLVDPGLLSPAVMVNLLGQEDSDLPYVVEGVNELLSMTGVKLHIYGKKGLRKKRKLGHITALDRTVEGALAKAEKAQNLVRLVPDKQAGRTR